MLCVLPQKRKTINQTDKEGIDLEQLNWKKFN